MSNGHRFSSNGAKYTTIAVTFKRTARTCAIPVDMEDGQSRCVIPLLSYRDVVLGLVYDLHQLLEALAQQRHLKDI